MLSRSMYHPAWFYSIVMLIALFLCPVAGYLSKKESLKKFLLLLMFLGLSVPCITALVMIYTSNDAALISDFWHRLLLFKMHTFFFLFILLLMPCVICLAIWISLFFGYGPLQFSMAKELSVMKGWAILGIVIPLVVAPLIEELGWRGYGVDSLKAYFNLFHTSLLFGFLWAAWHLPAFFVKGYYQHQLWKMGVVYVVNFFVSCIVFSFLMNWVYYKTGRSIPALVLFHTVSNFSSMVLRIQEFTKCIVTVVLIGITVAIIACDKVFFFSNSY